MGSSRSLPLAVLVASAVLGLVTGVAAVVVATDDDNLRGGAPTGRQSRQPHARQVLGVWDAARSRAFARGDGAALADLYVAGSRTGAADRAVMRGYRERGLRVTGMRTQVLSATVLRETDRRITLLVTDVLTDAVALAGDERWALPHDRPSTRRVVLVRTRGAWRVTEAYAVD
jgi:hypothetical protein